MQRIDKNNLHNLVNEIRLFAVMRNESDRIPYWLAHYRKLGVGRFFIVDNNSSDDTSELLLRQKDVHVYQSNDGFQKSQSGRLWLSELMMEHGIGYWCVVADADELFAYPHFETTRLQTLTAFLDVQKKSVLECLLLDMYAEGSIRDAHYTPGSDPFLLCPWFDPDFESIHGYVDHDEIDISIRTYVGSTRSKIFGINAFLSKIALIRYHPEMVLTRGQHGILGGNKSDLQGVMFHFKFFSDFPQEVQGVIELGERKNCFTEWRAYATALRENPLLSLHDRKSVRLIDSQQLIEIGLMKTSDSYYKFIIGGVIDAPC